VLAQDERLTSRAAEELMREMKFDSRQRKEKSDEYAAAIILRDYLESHP
jgi:RNase H-fold protein (predicted Holliday junction resolvase)